MTTPSRVDVVGHSSRHNVFRLAIPPFIGANLVIGWIALRTLRLALSGRLPPRS